MAARRVLRLTLAALAAWSAGTAIASASPALVVDVETGRVLHAERATDPWFPASVTKLMTTYVALDMVRRGEAAMDQLLTVSESAAALPPSKMAFKPGAQIRLDNALRIIMVKSANDVAATIAENLGGSVEGFAEIMNETAYRLGMRESRFVNPHGLPDDAQQTSARDMAILARALLQEFPEQESLFQIGAIQFGRRVMRNHNGLIGRYPGADGMKTGFICASGFNVVASANRNGRRLITVVFGSPSANERTIKAASLFDAGFGTKPGPNNPTLEALPASALQSPPNLRPIICDRRGPMPGEDDSAPVAAAPDSNVPNLFSPNVMAFAGNNAAEALARTPLAPRAPVQPIPVWLGANPPSPAELAAQAAEEEAAEKQRLERRKSPARKATANAGKSDGKNEGKARGKASIPAAILAEPKDGKSVSLSFKPVHGQGKASGEAAAKPAKPGALKPADAKAPAARPAPKPQATAKPNTRTQ